MLTYVVQVTGTEPEGEIREKADRYAERLGRLESNSIPIYLAEYYLDSGRRWFSLIMPSLSFAGLFYPPMRARKARVCSFSSMQPKFSLFQASRIPAFGCGGSWSGCGWREHW